MSVITYITVSKCLDKYKENNVNNESLFIHLGMHLFFPAFILFFSIYFGMDIFVKAFYSFKY